MLWDPLMASLFIFSNFLIFVAYAILGSNHFNTAHTVPKHLFLNHLKYGLFIMFCGIGHLVMVWHMIEFSQYAMVISHGLTALISVWVAIGALKNV
jgi:hypothetical protein